MCIFVLCERRICVGFILFLCKGEMEFILAYIIYKYIYIYIFFISNNLIVILCIILDCYEN